MPMFLTLDNKIKVWDVLVPFWSFDINSHQGLKDIGHGKYETYLSNVDYVIVIENLAVEGVEWDYANGKPRGFEAKYMGKVPHS